MTSATAIFVDTLNVVESAILAVPPEYCVGVTSENAYENGCGISPVGLVGGCWLSGGGTAGPRVSVSAKSKYKNESRQTTREDVELRAGNVIPVGNVVLEVLCDYFLGRVREPVRELRRRSISSGVKSMYLVGYSPKAYRRH